MQFVKKYPNTCSIVYIEFPLASLYNVIANLASGGIIPSVNASGVPSS